MSTLDKHSQEKGSLDTLLLDLLVCAAQQP